jgi:hypothetical protein
MVRIRIWHASIPAVAGNWDEIAELVVTEEPIEAEVAEGISIAGRVADNTHGVKGISADAAFYSLIREECGL